MATASQPPLGEVRLCPKGSFDGVWIKEDGFEDRGRIEAAWVNNSGDTLGLLSGVFGPDPADGSYRWRATVSGVNLTVVLFEMSGTFRFTDPRMCPLCGTGQGEMSGTWREMHTGKRGRLKGDWGNIILPYETRRLELSGRWMAACRSGGPIETLGRPD